MEIALKIFFLVLALFFLDRIGLWAEERGWVYWRKRKPSAGALGNSLQELNSFLRPNAKLVVEHKQKELKPRDDQGDSPQE